MQTDPVRGRTLRWTFDDGPTKGKHFEHTFDRDGHVTYRVLEDEAKKPAASSSATKAPERPTYQVAPVTDNVYAVSYLASSGYTLTTVLDFKTGNVVAFASNEKDLVLQHGHLEAAPSA